MCLSPMRAGYYNRKILYHLVVSARTITYLQMVIILLITVVCAISQPATATAAPYNSLSLYPAYRMGISSEGQVYCFLQGGAVHCYNRTESGSYFFINKLYDTCLNDPATCSNQRLWVNTNGHMLAYVHHNYNTWLVVARIEPGQLVTVQRINFLTQLSGLGSRGGDRGQVQFKQDFLMLSNSTYMQFLKYNQTSSLFEQIYSLTFSNTFCTFTSDGQFIFCLQTNFGLNLYRFNGVGYTLANFTPLPSPSAGLGNITLPFCALERNTRNSYTLVVTFGQSGTYHIQYFLLHRNNTIVYMNEVESTTAYVSNMDMSQDCDYVVRGTSVLANQFVEVRLYQYDPSSNRYLQVYSINNTRSTPNSLFVSNGGAIFGYSFSNQNSMLYFRCNAGNCAICSNFRVCQTCAPTFTLTPSSQCACLDSQSLVDGACVSCSIPSCAACSSADTCSLCDYDYILEGNACISQTKAQMPMLAAILGLVAVLMVLLLVVIAVVVCLWLRINRVTQKVNAGDDEEAAKMEASANKGRVMAPKGDRMETMNDILDQSKTNTDVVIQENNGSAILNQRPRRARGSVRSIKQKENHHWLQQQKY